MIQAQRSYDFYNYLKSGSISSDLDLEGGFLLVPP